MTEGAAATRRPGHAPPLLGIGQVLAKLQPEFPDLTPSKLRFLEEQGLVTPSRTAAGYRKFSPADVDRLHLVLAMQRDYYLPAQGHPRSSRRRRRRRDGGAAGRRERVDRPGDREPVHRATN